MKIQAAVLLASLCLVESPLGAQDSAATRWRVQSPVQSAAVALDAALVHVGPGMPSVLTVNALFAPFVSEQWQLGVAPVVEYDVGAGDNTFGGAAAVVADYYPFMRGGSGPFAGAYLSEGGGSGSAYGVFGLQAGWLQFLTPQAALRSQFQFRRVSYSPRHEAYDVVVALEPYLFGRANERLTKSPGLGVFDASLDADYVMRPSRSFTLNAMAAPFLTRWLQVGASGQYQNGFSSGISDHAIEAFGRVYLPLSNRLLPFADGLIGDASIGQPGRHLGHHGARAGVRTYIAPGVSIDGAFEWRAYGTVEVGTGSFRPPAQRLVRVTLNTQLGTTRD